MRIIALIFEAEMEWPKRILVGRKILGKSASSPRIAPRLTATANPGDTLDCASEFPMPPGSGAVFLFRGSRAPVIGGEPFPD